MPAPGFAGDGDELALAGVDRHVVEDQRPFRVVAKRNVVEHDLATQCPDRLSFGTRLRGLGEERANLVERRADRGHRAEGRTQADDRGLEQQEQDEDDEKVSRREGPRRRSRRPQEEHRAGQEGQRGSECLEVRFEGPELQLRALLLAVIPSPGRERGPLRSAHAQSRNSVDDLEQPARQAPRGVNHPSMGRHLPETEHHGHDQGEDCERGGKGAEPGVIEEDEKQRGREEDDRQHRVGDHPLHGVAKSPERHSPHGEFAGRIAMQEARGKAEQAIPRTRPRPGRWRGPRGA